MLDIQMLQMSNQKYRRTNFDEEENSTTEVTPPSEMPSPATNFNPTVSFQHYKVNFWRRRSSLEKFLGVLVICLLVIIAILAIVLKVQGIKNAHNSQKDKKVCTSKSCISAASSILNAIDESVNPCNDFYQFCCGSWIKSHPIPAGHSKWDTFGILREANYFTLKRFLDLPVSESDNEVHRKMKDYYTSCMDPSNILEKLDSKPLIEMMEKVGGWSIGEVDGVTWNEEGWKLQDITEKMHMLGFNVLFTFAVSEDEKEPMKNILKVDQVMTMLGKDNYANKTIENNTVLEAYLKYMVDLGVMLGGGNETRSLMVEVFNFERSLNEICTSQEDKRDDEKNYHKKNISELQQLAPFVDWLNFINKLLVVANISVNESEPIVVYSPEFLVRLTELLNRTLLQTHGKRTIHNYMVWNLVNTYSSFLSKSFRAIKKEFLKVLMGTIGEEEHWRTCVSETDNILGFALGAMYVKEKFHSDSKMSAEIMIENIKKAFIGNLPKLEWMDDETRAAAIDKANAVVDKIGYPDFILNSTALNIKYSGLQISKDEFFMNNFRAINYTIRKVLERLRKAPEKSSWGMSPPTVNAYYTPVKNEIVFPAGILQAPFYDKDFPKSLNYGAVGVVMGHELTHGFDDQGREYDKHGVLRMWWNENSIKAFQNRTKCLVDQYSGYSLGGEQLKGKQTLGENIADNGGLKSAYYAYNHLTNQHEPLLPGLNFTHKQLFFIAFAQVWCTTSTAGDISNSIMSDSHSLPNFRVIGSVSNLPEFSEEFNCPIGSPMNPKNKCEVW